MFRHMATVERVEVAKQKTERVVDHLFHQEKETAVPMQYGDERELLLGSIQLVETLQLWVNGTGIDFDESRQIAQKSVEALWKHCTRSVSADQFGQSAVPKEEQRQEIQEETGISLPPADPPA